MEEPSLRSSKLALAGGVAATLLIGAAGFLLGRSTTEREPVAAPPPPVVAAAPALPPAPVEEERGVLDRGDLIALAAAAADAAASGRGVPPEVLAANGRRFELRLPFGCDGPANETSQAPMRWRYDPAEQVLRVQVVPIVWTAADWPTAAATPDVEAVEGFWVARPWSASEACTAAAASPQATGTDPVTLPGQTLAIAQFFAAGDTRQGRRDGRPFQTSKRVAPAELAAAAGFRLRLSGRIGNVPGGGPAQCRQPGGPEQRPICVVAATMDEVALENPTNGEILATWNLDRPNATDG